MSSSSSSKHEVIDLHSSSEESSDYYSSDSEDGLTELKLVQKRAHDRYLQKRNDERRAKERQKCKRKREEDTIHIDDYSIVDEYFNRPFGTKFTQISEAERMYANEKLTFEREMQQHSSSFNPKQIERRLLRMEQNIALMKNALVDRRREDKRHETERVANEQRSLRQMEEQSAIEKHLRAIEKLGRGESEVGNIRAAQYSRKVLEEDLAGKLSAEQHERLRLAKARARAVARVNLDRRFI